MSMDLEKQLQEAALVEADQTNPQFFTVLTSVENGNFAEATRLMSKLFKEGYYDVRLICYAQYAALFKQGIEALPKVLSLFKSILTSHWEKLYPIKDRKLQANSGLNWFFNKLVNYLDHTLIQVNSGKESKLWDRALALKPEQIEAIESSIKQAQTFFKEDWQEAVIAEERLPQILLWFVRVKQEGDKRPSTTSLSEESPPEIESGPSEIKLPSQPAEETEEKVHSSGSLEELEEKLALFERLIDKEAFSKAAVVAEDITAIIDNFNPAHYFPRLFANYFAKLAKNSAAIEQEWEAKESFGWSVLFQLYATDRAAFEKWQ